MHHHEERAWDEKRDLLGEHYEGMEGDIEEIPADGMSHAPEMAQWRASWNPNRGTFPGRKPVHPLRLLLIAGCIGFAVMFSILSFPALSRSLLSSLAGCRMGSGNSTLTTSPNVGYGTVNYTCLPYQRCWPTLSEWNAFNHSIGGHLKLTHPWAEPCYTNASSPACQQVAASYMNGDQRGSQYGSMEFLNWESCGQADCSLNSFAPLATPPAGICSLGRLSAYYAEVQGPDDISKTIDLAQKHGIRLSIKNSGHDYFGRSSTANSLAIWTHNMNSTTYHESFKPAGCSTPYNNVGEIGAGVTAEEAYTYFQKFNMDVIIGALPSVGIAGGFGQGGGHGPFGPSYGLMVDQAIEFEVVTADGQTRLINECTDPDLFWAMRGGGGGTYAVLTRYKFQLHPALPMNVYSFQANFPNVSKDTDLTKSQVHRDIVTALALNQTDFSNRNIAGYNFILPDHMVSLQVLPSRDTEALQKITAQYHDFLTSYPGLNITDNSYHTFNFLEYINFTELPSIARNGPVGIGLAESGRLLPRTLFQSPSSIDSLVDAFLQGMQISYSQGGGLAPGAGQIYATGPANQNDNSKTGVNPAWRGSLWEIIYGGIWVDFEDLTTRTQIQQTITNAVKPLKDLTPGGGCYMNEGDWTEEDWQTTFFGSNYDRLLAVKKKYDPTGLFNCWKCVGWTGADDPMYSCYGQSKSAPNPTIPLNPVS